MNASLGLVKQIDEAESLYIAMDIFYRKNIGETDKFKRKIQKYIFIYSKWLNFYSSIPFFPLFTIGNKIIDATPTIIIINVIDVCEVMAKA